MRRKSRKREPNPVGGIGKTTPVYCQKSGIFLLVYKKITEGKTEHMYRRNGKSENLFPLFLPHRKSDARGRFSPLPTPRKSFRIVSATVCATLPLVVRSFQAGNNFICPMTAAVAQQPISGRLTDSIGVPVRPPRARTQSFLLFIYSPSAKKRSVLPASFGFRSAAYTLSLADRRFFLRGPGFSPARWHLCRAHKKKHHDGCFSMCMKSC